MAIGETFTATTGIDTRIQTVNDDTVQFTNINQINADDDFDGGNGTDTIRVSTTTGIYTSFDLTDLAFKNYEAISLSLSASAWLDVSQFGSGLISNNLAVTVSGGLGTMATVRVDASIFSAAGWTFNLAGGATTFQLTIAGTLGTDNLTGSSGSDYIVSSSGDDTVDGGGGDDEIEVGDNHIDSVTGGLGADVVMTVSINGTGVFEGTVEQNTIDTLQIMPTPSSDFTAVTAATFSHFDQLLFWIASGTVKLSNALLSTADGNMDGNFGDLLVGGANDGTGTYAGTIVLDGSALTGVNRIVVDGTYLSGGDWIVGGAGNDSIASGAGNDTITAGGGTNTISGGAGSDTAIVDSAIELAALTLDAGSGSTDNDTLRLTAAGTYGASAFANISHVEAVYLSHNTSGWSIALTDNMASADRGTATAYVGSLTISSGVVIDASALTSGHRLVLQGDNMAGDDTITGGAGDDVFYSSAGSDQYDGKAGNDIVYYANWTSLTITYDSGTSTYSVTSGGYTDTLKSVELFYYAVDNVQYAMADTLNVGPDAVANGDTATEEGVVAGVGASGNVLTNDTDANSVLGDTKQVTGIAFDYLNSNIFTAVSSGPVVVAGAYGTLTINEDGSYSYVIDDSNATVQALNSGDTLSEIFTYRLADFHGLTDTADLTITIDGSNDAPTGADKTITIIEDGTPYTFSATDFGTDIDGSLQSVIITTLPLVGTLTLNGAAVAANDTIAISQIGQLVFTPAADANGSPYGSFGFQLVDNDGATDPVANTIVFDVTGVNDAPVITNNGSAANAAFNVFENGVAVQATTVMDVDGPTKIYSLSGVDAALFNIGSTGIITFKAAPDFETPRDIGKNNTYNVRVTVSDGNLTDFQDLAITVQNLKGNTIAGTTANNTIDLTHKIAGKGATIEEDKIDGKAGNDTINGLAGNDTLIGGLGKDVLTGGVGLDKFVFNTKLNATTNVDTLKDFKHDLDLIQLDDAIFKNIGTKLDSGEFYAKAGATSGHDANDRIIYDKATGKLYFDDDGSGSHAAILFATLTGKPQSLDAGDFGIV